MQYDYLKKNVNVELSVRKCAKTKNAGYIQHDKNYPIRRTRAEFDQKLLLQPPPGDSTSQEPPRPLPSLANYPRTGTNSANLCTLRMITLELDP